MSKKLLIPAFVILIALLAFLTIKQKDKATTNTNPHVDQNGFYVPFVYKGTFRNLETGKIFSYTGNDDEVLTQCIESKCQYVYFFADWNGNIDSPSLEVNTNMASSMHGKVISSTLQNAGDQIEYRIEYAYNGKPHRSSYTDNLCSAAKGGGKSCRLPAKNGNPVNVITSADGTAITYATFSNAIKAEVIDLVQVK